MRTIMRNLIFWGKNTEKMVGMILAFCVLYSLLFAVDGENYTREALDIFFMYTITFSIVLSLIAPANITRTYLPIVVSFGAKRKETLWGIQWMNFLLMIQSSMLTWFAVILREGTKGLTVQNMVLQMALLTAVLSLGQFINALFVKLGSRGAILIVIISVLMGVALGMTASLISSGQLTGAAITFLVDVMEGNKLGAAKTACVLFGVSAFYAVSILPLYLTLRKYEVA